MPLAFAAAPRHPFDASSLSLTPCHEHVSGDDPWLTLGRGFAQSAFNSTQLNSSQVKSSPVQSSPVQSSQVQPSPVQSSPAKSSPAKSSQVQSSQVKSSQVQPSQIKSSQAKSSQVKSSQVKSRQGKARQGKASRWSCCSVGLLGAFGFAALSRGRRGGVGLLLGLGLLVEELVGDVDEKSEKDQTAP